MVKFRTEGPAQWEEWTCSQDSRLIPLRLAQRDVTAAPADTVPPDWPADAHRRVAATDLTQK